MNKKKEITNLTKELFVKKLYVDISMQEILDHNNITLSEFNEHFDNKRDLYFDIVECTRNKFDKKFIELAKKNNKDIKNTFVDMYKSLDKNDCDLIRNIFNNLITNNVSTFYANYNVDIKLLEILDVSEYPIENRLELIETINSLMIQHVIHKKLYGEKCLINFEKSLEFLLKNNKMVP